MKPKLATVVAITLLAACAETDPGYGRVGQCLSCGGALHVAPNPVIFNDVRLGEVKTIDVEISNLSTTDTIEIRSVKLVEDTTDDPAGEELFMGGDWFTAATLRPEESRALSVDYRPSDRFIDWGRIEMPIDGDGIPSGIYEVPIQTAALDPDISTEGRIDFPTTAPGRPRFATAKLSNAGLSPLVIRDSSLTGADEFSVTFYRTNPDTAAPEHLPDRVQPGESFWYRVFFEPTDRAPRSGQLTFLTNDPDEEFFSVELEARQAGPCISGSSNRIDFGDANIGYVNAVEYRVSNCADEPLTISRIAIADSDDSRFQVSSGSLPRAFPVVVEPGEALEFTVIFRPRDTTWSSGTLIIGSDDPTVPVLSVPLGGRGSSNKCPTASFDAIPVGQSRASPHLVPIDSPTTLDSSRSFDPDGQIVEYEWTVLDAPAIAVPSLIPSAQSASPTFVPTAYGSYEFGLRTYDAEGRASCNLARLTVTTIPNDDIAVVLRWETPGDPDPSDGDRPDVDLHLRHPLGRWNQPPYDIFSANPTADWGAPGPTGNPSLTEFGSGLGPELLEFGSPETFLNYAIGAYVFDARGMGPSIVKLDVFVRGVLAYSETKTVGDREFWHAVDVSWPSGTPTPVNSVTNGFP